MTEDVRADILTASLDLMNEGGLGALSMREVARRAGVSHQAPYHYFADRESILAELVRDGFEKLRGYMVEAAESSKDRTARVTAMGEAYVRFALDYSSQFRLMFRAEMVDMERHPEAKAQAQQTFDLLVTAVAGPDKTRDTADLAPIIASWSLAHGLATLLLEGKLAHHFGDSREKWNAAMKSIFSFYAGKFEPGPKLSKDC